MARAEESARFVTHREFSEFKEAVERARLRLERAVHHEDVALERKLEALEDHVEKLKGGQHVINVAVANALDEIAAWIAKQKPTAGTAVAAKITIGADMANSVSVDATNETATVSYQDDKGDAAAEPAGAAPVFTSSDPTVATVAADPANPLVGALTLLKVGTTDIGVSGVGVNDSAGNPITVAPATINVVAGPATGAALTIAP